MIALLGTGVRLASESVIDSAGIRTYSQGVKANVIFFTKGYATENVWIYDARTNVPGITKKDRPLTKEHFNEFEKCFGANANGLRDGR